MVSKWKLALIDLDGTLYRGDEPIYGASPFVDRLRRQGIQPVFFTNNSTKTPQQVCNKLQTMGIEAEQREICTSAQASADWIQAHVGAGATVAYMGTEGVREALIDSGLVPKEVGGHPDVALKGHKLADIRAAVLGLDVRATYESLSIFCSVVAGLGQWVLTNGDVRLPVEGTFRPGNGALGSFVATATGIHPLVLGKPSGEFVDYALRRYSARRDEVVIIGDNLKTDILAGHNAGIYTIFVETGVVYQDDATKAIRPDETAPSVADLFL